MPYLTSAVDGARIYYRIHNPTTQSQAFRLDDAAAKGSPPHEKPTIVFSHGWPMNSRMFDHLVLPLVQSHQYRCVTYDRRGFGKSDFAGPDAAAHTQPLSFDVFAADFAQVLETTLPSCDGKAAGGPGFVGIGSSMGCGELVHTLHLRPALQKHCRGLVFVGSNLPNAVHDPKTNPLAPTTELWASILAGLRDDRQAFVTVALAGVFGAHVGQTLSAGQQSRFERIIDDADVVALESCVDVVATADFTDELKELGAATEFPILVMHGDSDQGFPLEAGPCKIPELVPRATLKVYEKAAHGLYLTHKDQCMKDILNLLDDAA